MATQTEQRGEGDILEIDTDTNELNTEGVAFPLAKIMRTMTALGNKSSEEGDELTDCEKVVEQVKSEEADKM